MLVPVGDHLKLGEWGEQTAAQYLEARGYTILERRYRCPPQRGDLDLIAHVKFEGRDFIVFVEVKTRRSKEIRVGEAAVDWGKKKVMIKLARAFLQRLGRPTAWRYDVMSIYPNQVPGGDPEIEHFIEAFHEHRG